MSHITVNTAFQVWHHERISGTTTAEHIAAINTYVETVGDRL